MSGGFGAWAVRYLSEDLTCLFLQRLKTQERSKLYKFYMNEGTNLLGVSIGVLIFVSVLAFGCYFFFGFEIALIFSLGLLITSMTTCFVGLENVIKGRDGNK